LGRNKQKRSGKSARGRKKDSIQVKKNEGLKRGCREHGEHEMTSSELLRLNGKEGHVNERKKNEEGKKAKNSGHGDTWGHLTKTLTAS